MILNKAPYPGVERSLPYLRQQVLDSIRFCMKEIPEFKNPEDLFYYLKKKFTYESDPKNEELFQTVQTLLKNNYHGISGAGDCDDGTIFTLSSLIANSWYNCGIVLAGNNKDPLTGDVIFTHIYSYVDTKSGRKYLDLTNPKYDFQRYYNYKQERPIGISKNQIDMFLTLADGNSRKRKKNVDLQFLHLPSKNKTVREDSMDQMSLKDFNSCMLREGYTIEQISELAKRRSKRSGGLSRGGGKARREERRENRSEKKETRKENKAEKREQKSEKKAARTDLKKARAEAKRTRATSKAEARNTRAEAKKMRAQAKIDKANLVNPEDGTPLTKVIDATGNIIDQMDQTDQSGGDNFYPEEQIPDYSQPDEGEDQTNEVESYDDTSGEDLGDDNDNYIIFGTPVNKKAANVTGLGIGALVLYKIFK